MIVLTHVSKKFDQTQVISDLSVTIREGEIVGLLGPNGAGKTTTVRMIAGVLPPSRGRVTINDMNLFDEEVKKDVRIGYLPENNPLYDDMTVEEFLLFWSQLKSMDKASRNSRVQEVVKQVGLGEVFYRPIAELSKGYRQRVGIAQAILDKPDILLLDEPTEGLDPNQRREIHDLITSLGKKRTVIICSHVLSEITRMCNRIIIINRGAIVADSPVEEVGNLSGGVVYETMIKGKDVEKSLASMEGVTNVEIVENKPAKSYRVTGGGRHDLRLPIFELAKAKNWHLYELVKKQEDLEHIFAEVTK
jgi:ABC-2 type transport system ATP-binding protein